MKINESIIRDAVRKEIIRDTKQKLKEFKEKLLGLDLIGIF